MVAVSTHAPLTTEEARARVRALMPVEADLAFRRRCETVVEFLGAGSDARILDCGCGYGFILRVLAETTGAEIVGLDPESDRIEHARDRIGDRDRVTYVVGDAQALPFADETFSHVVCSEVLEHLDDDRAAVGELHRVLEPGGVAAITVPSADYPFSWDPLNSVRERLTGTHFGGERPWSGIWYGHKRLYRPDQLRQLLKESGFVVEAERSLTHSCLPFAHLVLYGILKPLLLSGVLPRRLATAGDRHQSADSVPSGIVRQAFRLLERIDRPNDDEEAMRRQSTFVALSIRGRKPP